MKQIGQSPETSLRLDGVSEEADVWDDAGAGAAANISNNSLCTIVVSGNSKVLGPTSNLRRRGRRVGIEDVPAL